MSFFDDLCSEIKLELRGAISGVLSVSENLKNGESVPDFDVYLTTAEEPVSS